MKSARGYGRARVAQLNPHSRNNNQSPPAGNTLGGFHFRWLVNSVIELRKTI